MKDITIEKIEKWLDALNTQYQIVGGYQNLNENSFKPRASREAPTFDQISYLREAHLNIIPILKELKELKSKPPLLHEIEYLKNQLTTLEEKLDYKNLLDLDIHFQVAASLNLAYDLINEEDLKDKNSLIELLKAKKAMAILMNAANNIYLRNPDMYPFKE